MRIITVIAFLVVNWTQLIGQEYQIKWDLSLGLPEHDNLYDALSISDDKFLFVARGKDANGNADYYIIKTDQRGEIDWERTYGGEGNDFLSAVIETEEGGFLLGGYSRSFTTSPSGQFDYWLLKVDSEGQTEWEQSYGGPMYDVMRAMVPNDRGYILIGAKSIDEGGPIFKDEAWVIQVDHDGNIIWEKRYGGSDDDRFHSAIVLDNQNILFSGITKSNDGMISNNYGNSDVWVVLTDSNGEIIWENTYGGSSSDIIGYNCMKRSIDNNFLLYGNTGSNDHDLEDFSGEENGWVWKINDQGEVLWSYAYGHEFGENINDVKELGNNKMLLLGGRATIADPFAAANYWLLVIDETDGKIDNEQMFGGSADDWGLRIIENTEGDIILAGTSNSTDGDITNKVGMVDIWLACLEEKSTNTIENSPEVRINIYPNPVDKIVQVDIPDNMEVSMTIYNQNGKLILGNLRESDISIDDLATGVYFIEVNDLNSKLRWTKKIVKQ